MVGLDLGFEVQVYPTGLLSGGRIGLRTGQHSAFHIRLGHNLIRHRDLGVQDEENGNGWGGSLGYRYYFPADHKGYFLGIRTDLWNSQIRWKDFDSSGNLSETGQTQILVIQPTAEIGYLWLIGKNDNGFFAPTLSLGREINVLTQGREVGQGAILLIGIQLGLRLPYTKN